MTEGSI